MDFPAEVLRRAGVADEQRRLLVPGFDMANHDFRWALVMSLPERKHVKTSAYKRKIALVSEGRSIERHVSPLLRSFSRA